MTSAEHVVHTKHMKTTSDGQNTLLTIYEVPDSGLYRVRNKGQTALVTTYVVETLTQLGWIELISFSRDFDKIDTHDQAIQRWLDIQTPTVPEQPAEPEL